MTWLVLVLMYVGADVWHHERTWNENQNGVPLAVGCHWRVQRTHLPLMDGLDKVDRDHVLCYAPASSAVLRPARVFDTCCGGPNDYSDDLKLVRATSGTPVLVWIARPPSYTCDTAAHSTKARHFRLVDPFSAHPSSSIGDAPLMDPPVTRGKQRAFAFSNQCDNLYAIRLDPSAGGRLTGTLRYFEADDQHEKAVPLTCREDR